MNIKSATEIILIGFLGIPILFGKINLIDNHEIIRYTKIYGNYFDYFLNHPEIIPRLQETTYRPLYYIIKGIFFFLFGTNSFLHYLIQYIIFVIVFINFNRLCKLFSKKRFQIFLISSLVLINIYSVDFIYRLGPQETYGIFFISFIFYWFCKYYCISKIPTKTNEILIILFIFLFSITKEPFAVVSFFISLIFLIKDYSKNKKINLLFLFSVFIQLLICIYIITNYIKNGHTYSGNEFSVIKTFFLVPKFLLNKFHLYFICLQLILIFVLKSQNNEINYKFFIFINFFYLLNYFLYQGWNVRRYYMIYILMVFVLNLYIFLKLEKKKFITIFNTYLILLILINSVFHYGRVYSSVKTNYLFNNAFKEISLAESVVLHNNILKLRPESYKSIIIFLKNTNNNIKIYNYKNNNLNEIIVKDKFFLKMSDNELAYKNLITIPKIEYCIKFIDEKINNSINCPPGAEGIRIL